jgi:hypothetical protein
MTQRCTECGNRSIKGLKPGHGKCQWHWDAGCFGREWSKQIHGPEPINPPRPGSSR